MMQGLAATAILMTCGVPAGAHRLDEYLQATMFSVARDRVSAQIRLTPGVAVFPAVMAMIDTDADRAISEAESNAYAEKVVRDVSLRIDGDPVRLRIASVNTAKIEDMKDGLGEIAIGLVAKVPRRGGKRDLVFENHHQRGMAAYLVNALVPGDPDLWITKQERSDDQAIYRLEYHAPGKASGLWPLRWLQGAWMWTSGAVALLLARLGWLWRQSGLRARRPFAARIEG